MITIYRWSQTPDEQKRKILARSAQDIDAFLPQAEAIISRVKLEGDVASKPSPSAAQIDLSLPDKPSIAVLPFANMSGDPEQEYFTDGITEEIITELSRFHSLFVIARNARS